MKKFMTEDSNSRIDLLTIKDLAGLFKISVSGARRLQQERRIPFIKIRGSIRFAKSDIVDYLKKVRVESIR
jgi:excisionase family DNA binding protein